MSFTSTLTVSCETRTVVIDCSHFNLVGGIIIRGEIRGALWSAGRKVTPSKRKAYEYQKA